MPETPSQPARITRRSFVKRTGATVIVTVLALHAFRCEARAEVSGGSSWKIKVTHLPNQTEVTSSDGKTVYIFAHESPSTPNPSVESPYKLEVSLTCNPVGFIKDGGYEEVSIEVDNKANWYQLVNSAWVEKGQLCQPLAKMKITHSGGLFAV